MTTPDFWREPSSALRSSEPWRALLERLGEVVRLPTPAAAWVMGLAAEELGRPLFAVVPHEADALAWIEASELFFGPDRAVYFPAPSLSPYQEAEISLLVRAEESVALDRVVRGEVTTVVVTPRALFRHLPRSREFAPSVVEIEVGEELPLDVLIEHLTTFGYHRGDLVVEVGQFAVRGGVFDFYPPGEALPLRLDLFGDTVESIQRFDPETQRSEEKVDAVRVLPLALFPQGPAEARRLARLLGREAMDEVGEEGARLLEALAEGTGFDGWENYLPLLQNRTVALPELLHRPLIVCLDRRSLLAEVEHHREQMASEFAARRAQGRLAAPPEALEHGAESVERTIAGADVNVGDLLVSNAEAVDFGATSTDVLHDQLPRFPREVETARSRGDRVVVVTPESHRAKLGELLEGAGVELGHRGAELYSGDLQRGFRLPAAKLTTFGERQLLRRAPIMRRAKTKARYGPFLSSLRDLKVGDYVVHVDHGIGQFVGLRSLGPSVAAGEDLPPAIAAAAPQKAEETEVMELVYSGGKSLLLPLSRVDQVQKYSGIEGAAPRLDKLGGTSWAKTKKRIKRGLRDMAQELLELYAERQTAEAPPMQDGHHLQRQFDAAFEYEETPDQLEAWQAIRKDLESKRPMDRLLCGDVGFGKTEVAMRAAMKAVASGYQVAVLAPTTILADQHLETFRRRFGNFPVNVEMISRFRSNAEIKEIQKKMTAGQLDILVGTHRLLNRGLKFSKLGLLVVDEEQRFGVAQKERLKQLKTNVHVLAMSATPVPRTLQLSLAGVRDLSLIETPPRDRMAVETAIVPFDGQLIREAIEAEIERGGQVFYVYNRVETIERIAGYLREVVPGLKLTVGHGQLDEGELAKRMHAFIDGEYHVLLATTIIENGIDIPNVNTIFVHHADRFGLAQLYQLRGRVGRSDQLAYCYLLVPSDRILSQNANKRLAAIREFTELGAGFRVAGRDLEIRGAGNLLGAEQSGHISALGIETYLKLLEEAVAELRGEKVEEEVSVALDLPVAMSIPESWVGDENLRIELYRRIAAAEEEEGVLLDELRDRFGEPPESVRTLIRAARVKARAEDLRLQSISARANRLVLRLRQDAKVDPERIIRLVSERGGVSFSPSGALTLENVPTAEVIETAGEILEYLSA